ncbi:sugar/nucleoside kinase (ribokinase family) [Rhizorhapis suberifaciens]|uniref:Sugar/nucleoside kinase (Ribokinase family) n=1 Tax=Rhizorhapis suberifaciens TaxID=13656 RepID=A0A840HRR3_9SPHN|nr:sugar/nucleoside kinase (ribokinase family) [Rhizorhapis suberifaciens]
MTQATLDIVGIGNAIVDVIAQSDDAFIASHALNKGAMQLVDAETAELLYGEMGPGLEVSGGSAANTLAGMAALGMKCGFIGQVSEDQLGGVFAHDIRALGIHYTTPASNEGVPTARCLILVTPDAQRTMNTFLGASQYLPASALDPELIASARMLYLEGYLWDPEEPRKAMRSAIALAREAGREVAFTLSDNFCIARHRDDFCALIDNGQIDVLFANEGEIKSLNETDNFEKAVAATAGKVRTLVVTRSEKGAIAVQDGSRYEVAAEPVPQVVDTTGAGDLFAAGFLTGYLSGRPVGESLSMGAIAAAEVISHYGARAEADLKALMPKA